MPLVFIAIGLLFVIAAVRGTVSDGKDGTPGLITLLKGDFWGQNSFLPWMAALFIIGAIGYIPGLKPVSWAFFLLVLIVIILANNRTGSPGGGFFQNFMNAINGKAAGTPTTATSTANTLSPFGLTVQGQATDSSLSPFALQVIGQ